MKREVTILIADDDDGHALLIRKNLKTAGITNPTVHLRDGQEVLDFLFGSAEPKRTDGSAYVLLLDIRMPKVDGIEVLRRVKADPVTRKMPVLMVTTTDDPREISTCHDLGCSTYITKPIDYDRFVVAVRQLGLFLLIVEVPPIGGPEA